MNSDQPTKSANRSLQTEVAEITRETHGLLTVMLRPGTALTGPQNREVLLATESLAAGSKLPVLVDLRGLRSADREARLVPVDPKFTSVIARVALLVGSPVTRVIASFFIRIAGPAYPTRAFSSESAAREWLQGYQGP